MAKGDMFDIEGDLGELDYAGITLNAVDAMVKEVAEDIVMPAVQDAINSITHETEDSIKVKREGFFDPRGKSGVAPTYSVYSDPSMIEHAVILEYHDGGKDSFMRKTARARKVKKAIKDLMMARFPNIIGAMVKNAPKSRKKK